MQGTVQVTKIISGGQTGADEGGLRAAKALGLATGGVMPKFFQREDGYREDIAKEFGLVACATHGYPVRTRANVASSDGTLLFGNKASKGSSLTAKVCLVLNKPCFYQPWPGAVLMLDTFRTWLKIHKIKVLNVAGNRESAVPGIGEAVSSFLFDALRQ